MAVGRADDNKRDKLERILRAARHLFRAHGFDGTTMDAVAARAGVSKGALFFHVGSKAELLGRIFEVDFRSWVDDAFADPLESHVLDQLIDAYGSLLLSMCAQPELTLAYMRDAGSEGGRPWAASAMDRLLDRTAALLRHAQARRELTRRVDCDQLAYNLWALYFVEQHRWLLDAAVDEVEVPDRLRAVFGMQLAGFLRPGAARDAARRAGSSRRAHRHDAVAAHDEAV